MDLPKLNQEPVMVSYPYGEGTVIPTSLFSDFANAHSQMSGVDEAHIVRDLLTCASKFYDKIKGFGQIELNAFGKRFQEYCKLMRQLI